MATINFKHLRYFWAVAKSGSIARASAQLHVTPHWPSWKTLSESDFSAASGVAWK